MRLSGTTLPLDDHSSVLYQEQYLERAEADQLLAYCTETIAWTQSRIVMFGKRVSIPRLNAWYGDYPYRYSGTSFDANPLPALLLNLQSRINRDTGWQLNSLLANLYRHGNDNMGWHSDDEKSLGDHPQIASISLGANRKFVLRDRTLKANKHGLQLAHGSLLLMLGRCQQNWQHALPKTTRVCSHRVNLTFRESRPLA